MPASYDEYFEAFADLTGTSGETTYLHGHEIADVDHWIDLFENTGIDFIDHDQQIDAFENFLIAFYPTEGEALSGDEWFYIREEFYNDYGLSEQDIDWDAYREAIGYGD
jgi:hypothetical protein